MRNSKTTKELYEKLLEMPDLHSKPELDGEILIWKLYKNAYVRAYCDSYDTCIDIISNSAFVGSLTHWHPEEDEMLNQLYSLGKKGNILAFNNSYFIRTSIFYIGELQSGQGLFPQDYQTGYLSDCGSPHRPHGLPWR